MPAKSQKQQRFMGMVHAAKKGTLKNPSPEVARTASSMSDEDAKDFASTKHKGLPEKVAAARAFATKLAYMMPAPKTHSTSKVLASRTIPSTTPKVPTIGQRRVTEAAKPVPPAAADAQAASKAMQPGVKTAMADWMATAFVRTPEGQEGTGYGYNAAQARNNALYGQPSSPGHSPAFDADTFQAATGAAGRYLPKSASGSPAITTRYALPEGATRPMIVQDTLATAREAAGGFSQASPAPASAPAMVAASGRSQKSASTCNLKKAPRYSGAGKRGKKVMPQPHARQLKKAVAQPMQQRFPFASPPGPADDPAMYADKPMMWDAKKGIPLPRGLFGSDTEHQSYLQSLPKPQPAAQSATGLGSLIKRLAGPAQAPAPTPAPAAAMAKQGAFPMTAPTGSQMAPASGGVDLRALLQQVLARRTGQDNTPGDAAADVAQMTAP